jgi:hypothetical protein
VETGVDVGTKTPRAASLTVPPMALTHLDRASTTSTPLPSAPSPPSPSRINDDLAAALFSTWVVVGLFVDGWAHNADKPETFWTPWHAVLYSGFVTGVAWFAATDWQLRRRGTPRQPDRLAWLGFGLFGVGGVADMVWHSLFGVEADVEALLSPSHLLLMIAGLLLVTGPIRSARTRPDPPPTWRAWREFAPAAVGITLAVAVVAFFVQFATVLHLDESDVFSANAETSDEIFGVGGQGAQVYGIVSILLPTALLVGALVWTTNRWPRPPAGTFTLIFGATAVLMAGLEGFERLVLVLPVAFAGALADAMVTEGRDIRVVATIVPVVMWTGWFTVYHAVWGLRWPAELPAGSVVLTGLVGFGLSLLTPRPASP